jgi:hypothetical protein
LARSCSGCRAHRDVDGQVAHALQVGDDLERGGDEAQVAGGRLPQRQDAPAGLVDGHLHAVDHPVPGLHLLGQGGVALDHGAHAAGDGGLDQAAHLEELLAQRGELGLVGLVGVGLRHGWSGREVAAYPNFPVT